MLTFYWLIDYIRYISLKLTSTKKINFICSQFSAHYYKKCLYFKCLKYTSTSNLFIGNINSWLGIQIIKTHSNNLYVIINYALFLI